MNTEQEILVKRLKEVGLHTRRFLKVDKHKAAFELEWQKNPYTPEELDAAGYERWGIIGRTGLVPVDTDDEEMAKIIRRDLPSTFETLPPRRGLPHFLFAVEGDEVPNRVLHLKGKKEGAGEIRSQNQYLVAAGTEIEYKDLKTGETKTGRYKILHDRPIAKVKYADFMEAMKPYLGGIPSQRITFEQMRKGVPRGTRHAQGIKYATFLIGVKEFDDATALSELKAWNQLCQPPMDKHDLERMVANARRYVEGGTRGGEKATAEKVDPTQYFTKRENGKIDKFIPGWLGEDIKEDFQFATMRDNEEVYVYQDGVYHRGGEVLIKEEARRRLTNTFAREGYINEAVAHIRETAYVDRKEFDNPYNLVAVENGLLDVLTGELQPHTPKRLVIVKLPVAYKKDADCPKIKRFLSEIHSKEDIRTVQEMVGYCLLRRYPFAVAFMLLGPGSNGKSTELNLIEALLGEENVATPALHDLLYNRFSKAELFQKLANIHSDIPSTKLKYTGTFKMLTGQDTLYMERKNKDPFYAKNYAKLIYSANELPQTEDLTLAFFRRWILFKFPNSFPENDPKTDPHILEKLTTQGELSGFLNWALKGLHRLLKQGHFTRTRPMEAIENEWIMKTDSLRAFVNERVKVEQGAFTTKADFYEKYKNFCAEHEIETVTMQTVGRRLPSIIPQTGEIHPRVGKKQQKAWKDILITNITEDFGYPIAREEKITNNDNNSKRVKQKKRNIGNIEVLETTRIPIIPTAPTTAEILDVIASFAHATVAKAKIAEKAGIPVDRLKVVLKELTLKGRVIDRGAFVEVVE